MSYTDEIKEFLESLGYQQEEEFNSLTRKNPKIYKVIREDTDGIFRHEIVFHTKVLKHDYLIVYHSNQENIRFSLINDRVVYDDTEKTPDNNDVKEIYIDSFNLYTINELKEKIKYIDSL